MTRGEALEILGLDSDAPLDAARKAYRTLAKTYHPDKNTASSIDFSMWIIINVMLIPFCGWLYGWIIITINRFSIKKNIEYHLTVSCYAIGWLQSIGVSVADTIRRSEPFLYDNSIFLIGAS